MGMSLQNYSGRILIQWLLHSHRAPRIMFAVRKEDIGNHRNKSIVTIVRRQDIRIDLLGIEPEKEVPLIINLIEIMKSPSPHIPS